MHYIKDIFEENITEHAHDKFVRYSKGNFVGPLLNMRIVGSNIKFNGSFHYVDELLFFIAEILGDKEIHVKGSLVWNKDLAPELAELGIKYSKVTKSRGIFKYILDNDIHMQEFMNKMGKYNILLNVKDENLSMVTKSSFPKPSKEFSSDFCKCTFPKEYLDKIFSNFCFDIKNTAIKKVQLRHEIEVDDIQVPNIDNFEEARKLAKRIGKLRRYVSVNDGPEEMKEISFKV